MGQYSGRLAVNPPAKKRLPRWLVYLSAIIVAGCFAAGCIGAISIALFISALDTKITETDFQTDTQRVQHLNSILPISIPASAANVQFTQQGFQDRHIDATFMLSPNDVTRFVQSLPPLDQPKPNYFEGTIGFTSITVEVDPQTGDIHLVWFET